MAGRRPNSRPNARAWCDPGSQTTRPKPRRTVDPRGPETRSLGGSRRAAPCQRHPRHGGRYDDEEVRSPSPDSNGLGPRAFSYEIQTAQIPPRFRLPTNINRYDGETNPSVWLDDFRLACCAWGATTDKVVIRNLPLYLADSARAWLEHLPVGHICSWTGLKVIFCRQLSRHVRVAQEVVGPEVVPLEARRDSPRVHPSLLLPVQ